jgi:energy-converting hydrogenase Eha subunit C
MNKNIVRTLLKISVVGALATAGWLDVPTAEAGPRRRT